jgi:hypothetical protein
MSWALHGEQTWAMSEAVSLKKKIMRNILWPMIYQPPHCTTLVKARVNHNSQSTPQTSLSLVTLHLIFDPLACNIIWRPCNLSTSAASLLFNRHYVPQNFGRDESRCKVDADHLYLPSSTFFLSAFCPWYMNESMMPETVNTPEEHSDQI